LTGAKNKAEEMQALLQRVLVVPLRPVAHETDIDHLGNHLQSMDECSHCPRLARPDNLLSADLLPL
jgi:hypothetical protein